MLHREKIREYYLTEGSWDKFGLENIPSVTRPKLAEGAWGKVSFQSFRKVVVHNFIAF